MDTTGLTNNNDFDMEMDCQFSQTEQSSHPTANCDSDTDMDCQFSQTEQSSHSTASCDCDTVMDYQFCQTEKSSYPTTNGSCDTDMDCLYSEIEQSSNLITDGCLGTGMGYDDKVFTWNIEPQQKITDQDMDVNSRYIFWKPLEIEEEENKSDKAEESNEGKVEIEEIEENEEEEELSEVLLIASQKYSRTMEALNMDPNLSDIERQILMENTTKEYMKVISDNPSRIPDLIQEDELDDEEEDESDTE